MKIRQHILLFIASSFFILACTKDGAVGPQGIQGEQGVAGADGIDGQDGAQGTTGTANVIYSEWITADFGETPITEEFASDDIDIPELTDEIKNSGLLIIYGRKLLGTTFQYYTLPFHEYSQEQYFFHRFNNHSSSLKIVIQSIYEGHIVAPYLTEFRYVIVPGGIPSSGKTALDFSNMSYQEICSHLNISE